MNIVSKFEKSGRDRPPGLFHPNTHIHIHTHIHTHTHTHTQSILDTHTHTHTVSWTGMVFPSENASQTLEQLVFCLAPKGVKERWAS